MRWDAFVGGAVDLGLEQPHARSPRRDWSPGREPRRDLAPRRDDISARCSGPDLSHVVKEGVKVFVDHHQTSMEHLEKRLITTSTITTSDIERAQSPRAVRSPAPVARALSPVAYRSSSPTVIPNAPMFVRLPTVCLATMHCVSCGSQCHGVSSFCWKCGAPIIATARTSPQLPGTSTVVAAARIENPAVKPQAKHKQALPCLRDLHLDDEDADDPNDLRLAAMRRCMEEIQQDATEKSVQAQRYRRPACTIGVVSPSGPPPAVTARTSSPVLTAGNNIRALGCGSQRSPAAPLTARQQGSPRRALERRGAAASPAERSISPRRALERRGAAASPAARSIHCSFEERCCAPTSDINRKKWHEDPFYHFRIEAAAVKGQILGEDSEPGQATCLRPLDSTRCLSPQGAAPPSVVKSRSCAAFPVRVVQPATVAVRTPSAQSYHSKLFSPAAGSFDAAKIPFSPRTSPRTSPRNSFTPADVLTLRKIPPLPDLEDCGAVSRSSSIKPQGSTTSTAASTSAANTIATAEAKSGAMSQPLSSPSHSQGSQSQPVKRVAEDSDDIFSSDDSRHLTSNAADDAGLDWMQWHRGMESQILRCHSEQRDLHQALALQRSRNQKLAQDVNKTTASGTSESTWRLRIEQEDQLLAQHQDWCQAYGKNLADLDALLRMREQELDDSRYRNSELMTTV